MKILYTLFVLFVLASCNSGADESKDISKKLEELKNYPRYRIVARKFNEEYQLNPGRRGSIELAKKPDGWYVIINELTVDQNETTEKLFWSLETGNFSPVQHDCLIKRMEKLTEEEFDYFMRVNNNKEFYADILPYAGYLDSYSDIIDLLEGYDDLNDTLAHALGTAYFAKTQFLLGHKSKIRDFSNDHFKPTDFDSYMEYAEKCKNAYKIGISKNSSFKSFIGKVRTKMSNDLIGIWYEMFLRGYGEKAISILEGVDYPKSLLDFAENTLNSCEKNAILFTNGDNDTYPLWYLQHKKKIRTDISVINTSLLGAPFYSVRWKKMYSIPFSLDEKFMESDLSEIIMFDKSMMGTNTMENIFESMSVEKLGEKMDKKVSNSGDFLAFPPNWALITEEGRFVDAVGKDLVKNNMLFSFNQQYIYRSDLLIMNIIYANKWIRPIYFAETATSGYRYLEPYFLKEGLVMSVKPYFLYENSYRSCSDTLKMKENLLTDYSYSKLTGSEVEERIVNGILNIYYQAVLEFRFKNKGIAVQLLDKAFEEFPGDLVEDKFTHINLALYYKDLGQEEKAKGIIGKLIKTMIVKDPDKVEMDRYIRLSERLILYGFKDEADELRSKI